jgi:renalase
MRADSSHDEPDVAIIGAGIAGLSCARALQAAGVTVRLFDKARKPGGRMSTRRGPALSFDHGAQYFTARDPAFAAEVEGWVAAGAARAWTGRIVVARAGALEQLTDAQPQRWVGAPSMSAIPRLLAGADPALDVASSVRIAELTRAGPSWRLFDAHGAERGEFARVVVATPAAQAAPLLRGAPALAEAAASVTMDPCWAVMLAFATPLPIAADGLFVHDSTLAWAARDASKPGRGPLDTWVVHATPTWTAAHWDAEPREVVEALATALADATQTTLPGIHHRDHHRWRYARADSPLPDPYLFDPAAGLAACGDWCGGPRVEGAWLSGRALAARLLDR